MRRNRFRAVLAIAAVAVLALASSASATIIFVVDAPNNLDPTRGNKSVPPYSGPVSQTFDLSTSGDSAAGLSGMLDVNSSVLWYETGSVNQNFNDDYAGEMNDAGATATWTASGYNPGTPVDVYGTWRQQGNFSSSAPYTINGVLAATVDHRVAPTSDLSLADPAGGTEDFQLVGTRNADGSGQVQVVLTRGTTWTPVDAVAFSGGTTGGGGGPELVTQLGILDLEANGGINPATGNPWQAGDTYRFAFTSSELTTATSSDINTYNTFVQNLANASSLGIGAAEGATWKAIASTANDDARDNTSTHVAVDGTGEAIFLLDGTTVVATDYIDLWSDGTHDNAINKTEELGTPSHAGTKYGDIWTGTQRWGYATTGRGATYGTADTAGAGPLGDLDGNAERGLWPYTSGTHWIWRWGGSTDYELPIYALSDPLTITGDATVIPEPSTFVLAALGLLGLAFYARRRRRLP